MHNTSWGIVSRNGKRFSMLPVFHWGRDVWPPRTFLVWTDIYSVWTVSQAPKAVVTWRLYGAAESCRVKNEDSLAEKREKIRCHYLNIIFKNVLWALFQEQFIYDKAFKACSSFPKEMQSLWQGYRNALDFKCCFTHIFHLHLLKGFQSLSCEKFQIQDVSN